MENPTELVQVLQSKQEKSRNEDSQASKSTAPHCQEGENDPKQETKKGTERKNHSYDSVSSADDQSDPPDDTLTPSFTSPPPSSTSEREERKKKHRAEKGGQKKRKETKKSISPPSSSSEREDRKRKSQTEKGRDKKMKEAKKSEEQEENNHETTSRLANVFPLAHSNLFDLSTWSQDAPRLRACIKYLSGELWFIVSWVFRITWYILRPWIPFVIVCWVLFDILFFTICSLPFGIWMLPQKCPPSNTIVLHLLCKIEPVKPLTWCVDKNVADMKGSDNVTKFGENLIKNNKGFISIQQASFFIHPLTRDLEDIRDGFEALKLLVSVSSLPLKVDIAKILDQLRGGTRVLRKQMSRFDNEAGRTVRLQISTSRETTKLLEQYGNSSNSWENIGKWMPLSLDQFSRLKDYVQSSTIRGIPERIQHQNNFMSPYLTNLSNYASEIINHLEDQETFVREVQRLSFDSQSTVNETMNALTSSRSSLSKILIRLKWKDDDANLIRRQAAALDHMDLNYSFAKRFFRDLREHIEKIAALNDDLKEFGYQMNQLIKESGPNEDVLKVNSLRISRALSESAKLMEQIHLDLMEKKYRRYEES